MSGFFYARNLETHYVERRQSHKLHHPRGDARRYSRLRHLGHATADRQCHDPDRQHEITDSRISQGSVVTSTDIGGDLSAELSYGSFDKLLEAAFYGNWTSNVLTVGDVRHTFSIAKNYMDVGVYSLFKGVHIPTFAMDIPSDGKVTVTFGTACLDYTDSDAPIVLAPAAPTSTPFMSNGNVGTLLVDGASMEGQACVSAMTISLDNGLQAQRCIGTDKMGPGAQIATEAAITGTITLAGLGHLEEHLHPCSGLRRVPDHRQRWQQVHLQFPGGGS